APVILDRIRGKDLLVRDSHDHGDRTEDVSEASDVETVKVHHSVESLPLLDRGGEWEVKDALNIGYHRLDCMLRDGMAEKIDSGHSESAFSGFQVEVVFLEGLEDSKKQAVVLLLGGGMHEDVIQVYF